MALRDFVFGEEKSEIKTAGFACSEALKNLQTAEASEKNHINEIIAIGNHLSQCPVCAAEFGERLFNLQKRLITQTAEDALLD